MAERYDWCSKLNSCSLFNSLRTTAGKFKTTSEAKSLLVFNDGKLYVWDSYNAALLIANLKASAIRTGGRESSNLDLFMTISCTNAPSFDIDCISCNLTSTYFFVSGRHGISVILLPSCCTRSSEQDEGTEQVLARTTTVAERNFVVSEFVLLQAAWHPGSNTSTHLVLLTSDNVIRIYNVAVDCDTPMTYVSLGHTVVDRVDGTLPSRHLMALGDTAVSFDFGLPVDLSSYSSQESVTSQQCRYLWPIYVLLGNGEVYRLITSTGRTSRPLSNQVVGPLRMYPPAEDNYGIEACSILCLDTQPQVVVVATCEGKLHHCLVLGPQLDDEDDVSVDDSVSETRLRELAPTPALYIYETVELELSLATVSIETDESLVDYFSCPIRLTKDPVCCERYHCSHGAGLHSLVLPWMQKLQHFCNSADTSLSIPLTGGQQAIAEHLVCTKPLKSSPVSPVLGVGIVSDHFLGNQVICLTSTLECIVLPLMSTYRLEPLILASSSSADAIQSKSPLRQLYKEPFDVHIRKILQRNSSNPVLKSITTTATPSTQECLQLVVRATQVFREEYIQKFEQAHEEVERRVRVLQTSKKQQLSELAELDNGKQTVSENTERLAQKFNQATEQQKNILSRIETVLRQLQRRAPMLSDAEKDALKELKEVETALTLFKSRIKTVDGKLEYQRKTIGDQLPCATKPVGHSLNSRQTENVRTLLKNESDDIAELVKQVKELQNIFAL